MKADRYLVTFELALVYTIILAGLILALVNPSESTDVSTADDIDAYSPAPLEPFDTCLCDHGLRLVKKETECDCQAGNCEVCSCSHCLCNNISK